MKFPIEQYQTIIKRNIVDALTEDIGAGDISTDLMPIQSNDSVNAKILSRQSAIFCGQPWLEAVFKHLDANSIVTWCVADGDAIKPEQLICKIEGSVRALLSGERSALNFIQCLSATATVTNQYAQRIKQYPCKLLDTRKTIPGLRVAQKYAVVCGGGHSHRMGLFDAFLLKENHLTMCEDMGDVIAQARKTHPNLILEVEVENLSQLEDMLNIGVDRILLDNFSLHAMGEAVEIKNRHPTSSTTSLEASGGIDIENIEEIAKSGVDYLSVGELTKTVKAIDFTMLF